MNKRFTVLSMLAALALFATACGAKVVQAQTQDLPAPAAPKTTIYQTVLGKSLNDKEVTDFIGSNYCAQTGQVGFCPSIGLAFYLDASQRINTVYLYASESSENAAYQGKLPFGLTMHDRMADVERKLGQPKMEHAAQVGWEPGLPDETSSTDHFYYWAIYKRFGVTVVYNSPSGNDPNATIYAILISL